MKLTTEQINQKLNEGRTHFKAEIEGFVQAHDMYQHYKGGIYRVRDLSLHTETNEVLVNYKRIGGPDYDERAEKDIIYSRPLSEWLEPLPLGSQNALKKMGRQTKRFVPVVPGTKWVQIRPFP